MTNEEKKAREIYDKFDNVVYHIKLSGKNENSKGLPISMHNEQVKQCALICVEEIIDACQYNNIERYNTEWWERVKQIIEQL